MQKDFTKAKQFLPIRKNIQQGISSDKLQISLCILHFEFLFLDLIWNLFADEAGLPFEILDLRSLSEVGWIFRSVYTPLPNSASKML